MSTVTLDKPFVFPIRVAGDLAPAPLAGQTSTLHRNDLTDLAHFFTVADSVFAYGRHARGTVTVDQLIDSMTEDERYHVLSFPHRRRAPKSISFVAGAFQYV